VHTPQDVISPQRNLQQELQVNATLVLHSVNRVLTMTIVMLQITLCARMERALMELHVMLLVKITFSAIVNYTPVVCLVVVLRVVPLVLPVL